MSNKYWAERQAAVQDELNKRSEKKIQKQLIKYYADAARKVISDFEATYNKLLTTIEDGREPTPADLYKLDKYWEMQGQLRQVLNKLGEKEVALLTKEFETNFFEVYYSLNIDGMKSFSTVNTEIANQLINSIWCLDGKHFSQRIWKNTELLAQTLNDNLVHCVTTGKKPTELVKLLERRFEVSYHQAETLVRTEIAHVQTEAAKKRYQDYGLLKYQILGNEDDSCGNHSIDCHKMDGKQFLYAEMRIGTNAPPFHPNCKCRIIPVVE